MNKYQYKVQGVDYDVEIEEVEGNVAKVIVNGMQRSQGHCQRHPL